MSSQSKTPNLQLNQWAATDPVVRTDFNADNAKLDAAVGAVVLHKLFTVVTQTDAHQVSIDMSGVDFSQYLSVYLIYIPQTNGRSCTISVNGTEIISSCSPAPGIGTIINYGALRLTYANGVLVGWNNYTGFSTNTNDGAKSSNSAIIAIALAQFSSVDFTMGNGSDLVKSGSQFIALGLKK